MDRAAGVPPGRLSDIVAVFAPDTRQLIAAGEIATTVTIIGIDRLSGKAAFHGKGARVQVAISPQCKKYSHTLEKQGGALYPPARCSGGNRGVVCRLEALARFTGNVNTRKDARNLRRGSGHCSARERQERRLQYHRRNLKNKTAAGPFIERDDDWRSRISGEAARNLLP
jgi:hypothetical protein